MARPKNVDDWLDEFNQEKPVKALSQLSVIAITQKSGPLVGVFVRYADDAAGTNVGELRIHLTVEKARQLADLLRSTSDQAEIHIPDLPPKRPN